jgi:hypothetical protein
MLAGPAGQSERRPSQAVGGPLGLRLRHLAASASDAFGDQARIGYLLRHHGAASRYVTFMLRFLAWQDRLVQSGISRRALQAAQIIERP